MLGAFSAQQARFRTRLSPVQPRARRGAPLVLVARRHHDCDLIQHGPRGWARGLAADSSLRWGGLCTANRRWLVPPESVVEPITACKRPIVPICQQAVRRARYGGAAADKDPPVSFRVGPCSTLPLYDALHIMYLLCCYLVWCNEMGWQGEWAARGAWGSGHWQRGRGSRQRHSREGLGQVGWQ